MALFMDTHNLDGGVKASDVAQAHLADLQTQDKHPTPTRRSASTARPTASWPKASIQ